MIVASTLSLILITAAWIRLTNLSQVGIRFEDEAAYFADARLWHRCAKALFSAEAASAIASGDKSPLKKKMADVGIDFGARYHKPCQGYTALGAAMMFLTGDRDVAMLAVNAVAGTASVFLLWLLGNLLFGQAVGLCAAALLALSPFHLVYCRSAYPDATMIAFSLAAVTVWAATRSGHLRPRRAYLLVGCLFGIAATCHFRFGSVLLAMLLVDAFLPETAPRSQLPGSPLPSRLRRWALMSLGFAIPLAAIEGTMRVAQFGARLTDSWFPVESLLEATWKFAMEARAVVTSAAGGSFWSANVDVLAAYPRYYAHYQGLLICAPLVIGLLYVCRSRLRGSIAVLPLAVIVVTGTLLVLQPYVVARGMSVTLPFLQLCAAIGIALALPAILTNCVARARSFRRVFVVATLVAVLASVVAPLRETLDRRSDLAAACATLASLGPGTAVVAEDPRKYEVYLEGSHVDLIRGQQFRAIGQPREMLEEMRRVDVRWVIADPQHWHYCDPLCSARDGISRWWQELEQLLRQRAEPIAEFPHVRDDRWQFLAEGPGLDYLDEMTRRGDGPIRIYDITLPPDTDRNESASLLLPITP